MPISQSAIETGVDFAELFARLEYDRELLQDVYEMYLVEYPKLRNLLTEALSRGDFRQIQVNAHTLKGMFASLSFHRASADALRIEQFARVSDLASMPGEILRLEQNANTAQSSLRKFCESAQ